jgi:hypothetical protein
MRRCTELITDAVAMLVAAGAKPCIRNGSKHIKVCWLDRHGHRHVPIGPCAPSDQRARANTRATLRRLLCDSGRVGAMPIIDQAEEAGEQS